MLSVSVIYIFPQHVSPVPSRPEVGAAIALDRCSVWRSEGNSWLHETSPASCTRADMQVVRCATWGAHQIKHSNLHHVLICGGYWSRPWGKRSRVWGWRFKPQDANFEAVALVVGYIFHPLDDPRCPQLCR